jgi:hypothetical protein
MAHGERAKRLERQRVAIRGAGVFQEFGSPHWTISATGSFEKRRDLRVFRCYFAFLLELVRFR